MSNKVMVPECTFSFMTYAAFVTFKQGLQKRYAGESLIPYVEKVTNVPILKDLQAISNELIRDLKFPFDTPVTHAVTFEVQCTGADDVNSFLEKRSLSIRKTPSTRSDINWLLDFAPNERHYIARIEKMQVEKDPLGNDSYIPAGLCLFEVVWRVNEERIPIKEESTIKPHRIRDDVFYMYIEGEHPEQIMSTYKDLFLSPKWKEFPVKFHFKTFEKEEDLDGVFTETPHGVTIALPLREGDEMLSDMYWIPNTMRVFEAVYNYRFENHTPNTTTSSTEMMYHVYVSSKRYPLTYGYSLECATELIKSFKMRAIDLSIEHPYDVEREGELRDVQLLPLSLTTEPFEKAMLKFYKQHLL